MTNSNTPIEFPLTPFFEQTADLLCIAGFDGYFKKANPALCKLLEYSEEELMASPINTFIHPDDQEITAKYRKTIHEGKPLLKFENRYLTKSGDVVWISWTSIPKTDQELVYAIAKDITHIKNLEVERNKLLTKLTKENEQLKELNYATSHNLRSPLSSLLTIFDLIDHSKISDPEIKDFVKLLENSSLQIKQTLDTHIDTFRTNRSLKIDSTEIRIPSLLDEARNALNSLINDTKTRIQTNFSAFDMVWFNPDFMKSILMNLLSNSIKYAHPARTPEISIHTAVEDGRKKLIFSDNGRGFDVTENKDKLFGLYQTFHDNEDSKGIGLYLVYNHITNLGGQISVDSTIGSGTTFTITFKDPA